LLPELLARNVPICIFDEFLVSPLFALSASPDLAGNQLPRNRSSRDDHRPQVPATEGTDLCRSFAWLSELVVLNGHLSTPMQPVSSTKSDTFAYSAGCTVNLILS
jgi:hypothetical protein